MASPDLGHIGGPVVIPNCVAVKLQWTLPDTRTAYNILHGSVSGGFVPTVAMCEAIMAALGTGALWDALKPFLHTNTQLRRVHMLDLRTPNNVALFSVATGSSGSGAGLPLAPQTALVVTLRTAKAGPGFRGRMYVPGWSSAATDANQVATSAAQTALGAWAASIITALSAQAITLAIGQTERAAYTGSSGSVHAARAAATVPVTQLAVRNGLWDTQRKRAGRT